eukprot:4649829-Prymnesium_polylepis.1
MVSARLRTRSALKRPDRPRKKRCSVTAASSVSASSVSVSDESCDGAYCISETSPPVEMYRGECTTASMARA